MPFSIVRAYLVKLRIPALVVGVAVLGFLEFALPAWAGHGLDGLTLRVVRALAPVIASVFALPWIVYFWGTRAGLGADETRRLDVLRELPDDEFAELLSAAFRRQGYSVEELAASRASGPIHLELRRRGERTIVQCKAWRKRKVSAHLVRATCIRVKAERATACKIVSCGKFNAATRNFALGKSAELIDGSKLLELLGPESAIFAQSRASIMDFNASYQPPPREDPPDQGHLTSPASAEGVSGLADELWVLPKAAPLCPRCNSVMVLRRASGGGAAGHAFWVCSRLDPPCKGTRPA